jgi:hypothetical protein
MASHHPGDISPRMQAVQMADLVLLAASWALWMLAGYLA